MCLGFLTRFLGLFEQLRQLGDVGRDPARLVLREQLGGRSPAGLALAT
jgi:hypothetical protein